MKVPKIVIDSMSGFCFGVVSAIKTAEKFLQKNSNTALYCLDDIVHNSKEKARLERLGIKFIDFNEYKKLKNQTVLIRAHGEPPLTYRIAYENNIKLLDTSCPVVLRLQASIREAYDDAVNQDGMIIIFGINGHAEVIGLLGQTFNKAIVISKVDDIEKLQLKIPLHLFSQTTQDRNEYEKLINKVKKIFKKQGLDESKLYVHYSNCQLVSSRVKQLRAFALNHQVIIFVSDPNSSNGKYLFQVCKNENVNTFFATGVEDLANLNISKNVTSIGICGATSTPRWLMEQIADDLKRRFTM